MSRKVSESEFHHGVHVISRQMADGYTPPSGSLNPAAATLAPWRFDIPEVPVTAIKDRDGDVWLLVRSSRWADAVEVERGQPYPDYEFVDLLAFAPLVECEDPRGVK